MICAGEPALISSGASGGLEPIYYNWNLGLPSTTTVTVNPITTEFYTVEATDQCGNTALGSVSVLVSEVHALFDLSMEGYHGFETTNLSSYIINDSIDYTWYIDGEMISNEFELAMQYSDMNDHIVSLQMENSIGCVDSIFLETLAPPTLYIPNAFSPDEDGVNDFFKTEGANIVDFEMIIFDRWGNIVFQSDDMQKTWNGGSRESSSYYGESELYAYKIVAMGRDGEYFEREGTITMIR